MPGKSISELTVFTNGDSGKVSTWSNIPYFFTETLIARGIKINRVDLSASVFSEKVFYRVLRLFKSEGKYDYFRSFIHFTDVKRRIKKAIRLYPNSQVNILLTFSFTSAGLTKKPTILFCDWTFEHSLNYFLHRAPNFFERQAIRREKRQIERSDLVISLFPGVAKEMKNRYKNKNILYLGNVINSLQPVSGPNVIGAKILSNNLLFVGVCSIAKALKP